MSAITEITVTASASFDTVVASLKSFDSAELAKLMKLTLAEMEKKMKTEMKQGSTEKKEKKKGSMAKGKTPKQLLKPRAWVDFVQAHATQNGWNAFSVTDKKGAVSEFAGSVLENEKHVFSDSKKPMAMKQAMSLSKLFWAPKEKIGTNEALYNEFDTQYVEPVQEETAEVAEVDVVASEAAPKKTRAPKKTDEEKAAEKAEKAEAKAAKKASEKAEKAPKAPKAEKAVVAAPVPTPKKSPAKKVEAEFSCPNDGNVYTFTYKGKNYLRNYDGLMWEKSADGNPGNWAGMWKNGAIDDSVAEPEYDEE
jgi:hypothetical protein